MFEVIKLKYLKWAMIVTCFLAAIVLAVITTSTIHDNNKDQNDLELIQQNERIEAINNKKIQLEVNPEYVYKYNEAERVVVKREAFVTDAKIKYLNNFRLSSLSYIFEEEIIEQTILVRFIANNNNSSSKIRLGSVSYPIDYDLYITKEKQVFIVPIVVGETPIQDILIEIVDGDIELVVSDFEIVICDEDVRSLTTGVFLFDEIKPLVVESILNEEQSVNKNVTYLVEIRNEYLYELSPNQLNIYIYKAKGELIRYGTLTGVGSVRDMEFFGDDYLIVVSRGNGAYIIDITDKKKPVIINHINTSELVSGLSVSGNIVFLANRYSGVEVYDLTNLLEPVFLTYIGAGESKEYIDCDIYKNYLYISCWAQNIVEVWDVSNLNEPIHVSTVDVAGHPYGIEASKKGLFVATGQHANTGTRTMDNYNYGTGNGVTIFNISTNCNRFFTAS